MTRTPCRTFNTLTGIPINCDMHRFAGYFDKIAVIPTKSRPSIGMRTQPMMDMQARKRQGKSRPIHLGGKHMQQANGVHTSRQTDCYMLPGQHMAMQTIRYRRDESVGNRFNAG